MENTHGEWSWLHLDREARCTEMAVAILLLGSEEAALGTTERVKMSNKMQRGPLRCTESKSTCCGDPGSISRSHIKVERKNRFHRIVL